MTLDEVKEYLKVTPVVEVYNSTKKEIHYIIETEDGATIDIYVPRRVE